MIIAPKRYQRRVLAAWNEFCQRLAAGAGAASAFAESTRATWGRSLPYLPPPCLGEAPAVCLRIPTGGGKTFVAAAACGIAGAAGILGGAGHALVVVWLVPSTAIAEQTLAGLRDPRHANHRALVEGAGGFAGTGPARILAADEALSLSAADVRSGAVVIVATIQSFRIEDTDQRAVYRQNGQLMDHGLVDPNLAAVLARYRPLVIVDEAHNARTDASFDALGRMSPAVVLELTATPTHAGSARLPSNVLISVSAHELHAEGMLKLPLELSVNADHDQCLGLALRKRSELQRLAEMETAAGAAYLRPLLLIQAQAKKAGGGSLTPDAVKRKLVDDHGQAEASIRIATGSVRELDDIAEEYPGGLESPTCPVTTIITVEALREGWDCPTAYVLCTLKGTFTDTAAVQIVGRVLRQPGATQRQTPALNRSYAVAAIGDFGAALGQLRDVLVESLGYERESAAALAVAALRDDQATLRLPLPQPVSTPAGTPLVGDRIAALPANLREKMRIDLTAGILTVDAVVTEDERSVLSACIGDGPAAVAYNHALRAACDLAAEAQVAPIIAAPACPAESGLPFVVPRVQVQVQELWRDIDDTLLTDRDWSLPADAAILGEADYTPRQPHFDQAEIHIVDGRVVSRLREGEDIGLIPVDGAERRLASWLDQNIDAVEVHADDKHRWILSAVSHLIRNRGLDPARLELDQQGLKAALQARIDRIRQDVRRMAVQELLFDAATRQRLRPSPRDRCFAFDPTSYPVQETERSVAFRQHYYRVVGAFDSAEERDCAIALDNLPETLTWVRNLVHKDPHSFRLPRRPGPGGRWFYPDFVALLRDGRTLVVEYKGADREDSQDTADKRAAGDLWARITGGVFVLVVDRDYAAIGAGVRAAARAPHPGWPAGYWERVEREGAAADLGDLPPIAPTLHAPDLDRDEDVRGDR